MLRPIGRRWKPDDVEEAKRLVSRAETQALERAEELRLEAEGLLRAAQAHRDELVDRAREEMDAQLTALRLELSDVTRRATATTTELELLRDENAELRGLLSAAGIPAPAPRMLRLVPSDAGVDRAAAEAAESAEGPAAAEAPAGPDQPGAGTERAGDADTVQARGDAMRILAVAAREAEALLARAVDTIEREVAAAADLRRQAEAEATAAAELRRRAEGDRVAAGAARDDSAAQHQAAIADREAAAADREVAVADRGAAAETLAQARVEAERILEAARREGDAILETARSDARAEIVAQRRQFAAEVSTLRQAMDRACESVDRFLTSEYQAS